MLKQLITVIAICSTVGINAAMNSPAEIKGYKFFVSNTGEYLPIKGMSYYPRPNAGRYDVNNYDFFTDEHHQTWKSDILHMKQMGVNVVRIYAVDPSKNHDQFMCFLAEHNMYALIGLAANCENCSISSAGAPECYPPGLRTRGELIINEFAKYDNVIGFSAGNEVNHQAPLLSPEKNAPCQKKFLRDMKAYIANCPDMRQIPVGVAIGDTDFHRQDLALYYNCQTNRQDPYEPADFFGLNAYKHCNGKDNGRIIGQGFQHLFNQMRHLDYSIPLLLSEFGCVDATFPTVEDFEAQRTFHQIPWLFGEELRHQFAGGFVFEYSTELSNMKQENFPTKFDAENYGSGYFLPLDCDHDLIKCHYHPYPNAQFLADQYHRLNFSVEQPRDLFHIPEARTKRTICPKHFRKLNAFKWTSDGRNSLTCPQRAKFICRSTRKFTSGSENLSFSFLVWLSSTVFLAWTNF